MPTADWVVKTPTNLAALQPFQFRPGGFDQAKPGLKITETASDTSATQKRGSSPSDLQPVKGTLVSREKSPSLFTNTERSVMSVLTPERTLPVAPPASPTKAEPNAVKEQLLKAAELIEEHGHAQFALVKPDGSICMFEALARAYGIEATKVYPSPGFGTSFERLGGLRTPGEIRFEGFYGNVCYFNNKHTKEECVTALRKVAATV